MINRIKNSSEILMIIFFIAFIIMLLVNILLITFINDKDKHIDTIVMESAVCKGQLETVKLDYERLYGEYKLKGGETK